MCQNCVQIGHHTQLRIKSNKVMLFLFQVEFWCLISVFNCLQQFNLTGSFKHSSKLSCHLIQLSCPLNVTGRFSGDSQGRVLIVIGAEATFSGGSDQALAEGKSGASEGYQPLPVILTTKLCVKQTGVIVQSVFERLFSTNVLFNIVFKYLSY